MIVLDTTVLVYAVGEEHPLRGPCRRLLNAHVEGIADATTTIEVIQEFVHVRARRRGRVDAAALGRQYAVVLPILPVLVQDLELALTLFQDVPSLGAFDAVLAACALNNRADRLVSADQAFDDVAGLPWMDPRDPDLDTLFS